TSDAPGVPGSSANATPPAAAAADSGSTYLAAPAADRQPALHGFTYLPVMIGDQSPPSLRPAFLTGMPAQARATVPGQPPTPPSPFAAPSRSSAVIPWARGFKIADNQSPMPQDRVFYSYNYFNNMNQELNRRAGS